MFGPMTRLQILRSTYGGSESRAIADLRPAKSIPRTLGSFRRMRGNSRFEVVSVPVRSEGFSGNSRSLSLSLSLRRISMRTNPDGAPVRSPDATAPSTSYATLRTIRLRAEARSSRAELSSRFAGDPAIRCKREKARQSLQFSLQWHVLLHFASQLNC